MMYLLTMGWFLAHTSRGRQGLKISNHLADLQFTAGSLLPMAIY